MSATTTAVKWLDSDACPAQHTGHIHVQSRYSTVNFLPKLTVPPMSSSANNCAGLIIVLDIRWQGMVLVSSCSNSYCTIRNLLIFPPFIDDARPCQ